MGKLFTTTVSTFYNLTSISALLSSNERTIRTNQLVCGADLI